MFTCRPYSSNLNLHFQVTKYTLEQKLHEQTRKISVQSESKSKDSLLIAAVEDMCKSLKNDLGELDMVECRLEQNGAFFVKYDSHKTYLQIFFETRYEDKGVI